MKRFLYILNPDEENKEYDESLEGFIGCLADEAGSSGFRQWKKAISETIKTIDPGDLFHVAADIFSSFDITEKENYASVGFAVGMAYADLVSERNEEAKKILDSIKRKLKKSGLLPYLPSERRAP
jgi:hypothetical protein